MRAVVAVGVVFADRMPTLPATWGPSVVVAVTFHAVGATVSDERKRRGTSRRYGSDVAQTTVGQP